MNLYEKYKLILNLIKNMGGVLNVKQKRYIKSLVSKFIKDEFGGISKIDNIISYYAIGGRGDVGLELMNLKIKFDKMDTLKRVRFESQMTLSALESKILKNIKYQIIGEENEGFKAINPETKEELIITKNIELSRNIIDPETDEESIEIETKEREDYEMLSLLEKGAIIECFFDESGRFFDFVLPKIIIVEIINITDIGSEEFKRATLKNGMEIDVPLYINIGDKIELDTHLKVFIKSM